MHRFKLGDRVLMASHWLKSTQAHDRGHVRGTVYHTGERVVSVEWDDGRVSGVLSSNLVHADKLHLELF